MAIDFQECETCERSKSLEICSSCFHNRTTIEVLRERLRGVCETIGKGGGVELWDLIDTRIQIEIIDYKLGKS